MQYKAHPDISVPKAQPAEENARADGRESFGHRFLKMDHRVRNGHRKDRVGTERRLEAMDQKAAKEKFETEKLEEIHQFPDHKRRAQIRIAVVDVEERVLRRKAAR